MMDVEVITIDSDSIYSLETHILKEEEREAGSESSEVVGHDAYTTVEAIAESNHLILSYLSRGSHKFCYLVPYFFSDEDKELPGKTAPVPTCM